MRCCYCSLPAGLEERKRTVKNWRCCCSSLPARLEELKWTVRNWRPKEIRERERERERTTTSRGRKKLLHVARVFRQSKMAEKRWKGMRRRRRCFNSQSLRLRNYIIFTAKRSPSLPQLSHNSLTTLALLSHFSLSLLGVTSETNTYFHTYGTAAIRWWQARMYVRTYPVPVRMYVLLQRSPVGTILYHLNTVGIRPRGG